jgi:hypothetical protein
LVLKKSAGDSPLKGQLEPFFPGMFNVIDKEVSR